MKAHRCRATTAGILVVALLPFSIAHAQLGDLMKQGSGGGAAAGIGGMGSLGGALPGQSLTSGSLGNVAGLLEFCIKNNYLGGDKASAVKDSLMGKLPGGSSSSDSGYGSGKKGILSSSDGGQLDLSGGGLKEKVTKEVCDKVLEQGKSML
ncbi:DUF2501 domain-containing protein [Accumulibacter sp.]|uniref:DUF2501 domain-containing protein n=1 Tax=Accumulibacter sp. TaxID=2053492 RepID=UPI001E144556|nr:DUF2501 domain-containing protein [Accumulibacter sp.]MCB1965156.1 DUF2501 domain-containing protein [Accumulibacter sp.]MCP5227209.1 DUF2501 domain-containing protein [Accumulibacter sp.]